MPGLVSVGRFFSGWLGQNFKTGFERILAFNQLQFGGPAAEQLAEQMLEVLVDLFEGSQQALTGLSVKTLDTEPLLQGKPE